MAKRSKNYKRMLESLPKEPVSAEEAIKALTDSAKAGFDQTIEAHFKLGIDTRQSDQQIRGMVSLPSGSGKSVRVAVFAEGEAAQKAKGAGAEVVGSDDLAEDIQKGKMDFDAVVATPDQMAKVGRLGRILGPRGLMPNPKLGTVTPNVEKAIADLKGGKVEYRADKFGICHVIIGKSSFSAEQLLANYDAVHDAIVRAKPAAAKGKYIQSIAVAATMSPSVKISC